MADKFTFTRDPNAPKGHIPFKFCLPAKVMRSAPVRAATDPVETAEDRERWAKSLLNKAKKHATDPAVLDETPPFFWQSEISNDRQDSYFTRMKARTLRSFAKNARDGVSFQYSHDWKKLGLGQSIGGKYEELKGGDPDGLTSANMRTVADFYTMPGMKMNADMDTDSFILGVRSGVLRDVSVGFYAERMTCGVCGKDMILWWGYNFGECTHVPGVEYDDDNGKGVAYAWIENGILTEVSQVYDGATPGAGHLKAYSLAESGTVDGARIRMMERQLRMKLPNGAMQVQGIELPWMGMGLGSIGTVTTTASGGTIITAALDARGDNMARTKNGTIRATDDDDIDNVDELTDEASIDDDATVATTDDDSAADVDDTDDDQDDDDDDLAEDADIDDTDDESDADDDESDDPDESADDDDGGESANDEDDRRAMLTELSRQYKPHGIRIGLSERSNITTLADAFLRTRDALVEARKKEAIADRYTEYLVDEAERVGIAANGKKHNVARYARLFRRMIDRGEIEDVEATIDEWREKAGARFGGGRLTTQGDDEAAPDAPDGSIAGNVVQLHAESDDDLRLYQ